MPVPPPAKGLSSGFGSFLKSNAKFAYSGGIGLAFLASDAKGILDADNKLKALLKTAKDFILIRVAMIGIFKGISDVVKGLVRDTGSLDQALKRLTQVQQYARQFQTFTGSLSSAKQKISELHQLSTRGVFKFEELVEANKALQVFTRGAYTSVEATQKVGEAALATGNNIGDTARAVGNFYDQLRAGKPVGEAAEQLRQMGLISGSTADDLTNMSESGASLTTTFGALTDALGKTAEGAAQYKDELQGVTAEHEKAMEELKTAFGAPWTEADIQTTKNMSDGLKSITPSIGKLSEGFAFLYNGASTMTSAFFKFVAGTKIAQRAIVVLGQAIMTLTVVAGLFGSVAMIPLIGLLLRFSESAGFAATNALMKLTGNFLLATRAGLGLEVVLATFTIGSVLLMAAGFVTAIAGAAIKAKDEAKKAGQEFQDWSRALKESTADILEQAAAVTTLASKYEVLAKTIAKLRENQKEQKKIRQESRKKDEELESARQGDKNLGMFGLGGIARRYRTAPLEREKEIRDAKKNELQRQQDILRQSKEEQAARQPIHEQLIKEEADRRYFFEQQSKSAEQRSQEARKGAAVAADAENKRSVIVARRMELESQLRTEEGKEKVQPEDMVAHQNKLLELQDKITKAKQEEQQVGLNAPEFSATQKEARAEQLRQAKQVIELEAGMRGKKFGTTEEKAAAEARLKEAKALTTPGAISEYRAHPEALTQADIEARMAKKREAEPPSPEEEERVKLQKFQIDNEVRGQYARARGDVVQARASQDLSRFTSHFDQLLSAGFGKPEAIRTALEQTTGDIAEEISQARPPVSAMTAIGGGGNLPQVDASLDIARRQEILQQKMVDYLAILSGQEQPEQKTQPVYQ